MGSFTQLLKETAPYSTIIVLVFLAGLVAIVTTYVRAQSSSEARAWPAFVPPLILALVAGGGFFLATFRLGRNIESAGVFRGSRIRVGAEGLSEDLQIIMLAASMSAILLAGIAIMTAISALRHVSTPRWTGTALVAVITGALLSVVALVARLRTMSALGMVMIVDSLFSPVIIPSLVAAVVALVAGAALAGEGGGAVGHASEEARDRQLGADVLAASIAAFGAVVLTLIAMQVRGHAVVFGALSGESVGGAQRARILHESAVESRAMLAGGVVAALPALVALALVCIPRLRIVLRGVSAGMRMPIVAVGTILLFIAVAPLSTWRATARLDAWSAVKWPAGFSPVEVYGEASGGDFQTDPVFVAADDTTTCKGALDSVPTKPTLFMSVHPGRGPEPIAVVVAKTARAGKLRCLLLDARRIRTAQGGSEEAADRGADIAFVVRVTSMKADDAVSLLTMPTRTAPFDEQLHVTRNGWKLRTRSKGTQDGNGTPPSVEMPKDALLLVTADEDVDAQRLLETIVATGSGGGVVLGTIRAGAFEEALPPPAPATPPPAVIPPEPTAAPAPLPMLPQSGFGSDYAVTANGVDPLDRVKMESIVRDALGRCAKEKGAAHVTFKTVLEDDGTVSPTAKPADRRGACLVKATRFLLISKRSAMKGETPRVLTFELGEGPKDAPKDAKVKRGRNR